jgi:hypothetical protein
MVTNQGPAVLATPTNSVIGRYAYAIYSEDGLLDANVAGYPQPASAPSGTPVAPLKGTTAFADLINMPITSAGATLTQNDVNQIVGWRNYVTAQASGTLGGYTFNPAGQTQAQYYNFLLSPSNSFLTTSSTTSNNRTDQMFTSRQALLRFQRASGFNPYALQYLTTFSREINAPTWSPAASSTNAINPPLANNYFTAAKTLTTYALDGSPSTMTVHAGDPLILKRFPLGRIAWLSGTNTGPNTSIQNAAAAVQQYFGLVWDAVNGRWIYTSPTGGQTPATSIQTLAAVAQLNREPDFFELLQAAILKGSLGDDPGSVGTTSPGAYGPAGDTDNWDKSTPLQVMRIGANIIDQYTADNYPSEIYTAVGPAPTSVYGIKNLPYLDRYFTAVIITRTTRRPRGHGFAPRSGIRIKTRLRPVRLLIFRDRPSFAL